MAYNHENEFGVNEEQISSYLKEAITQVEHASESELQDLETIKKLFKKNVPFSRRNYVAALLIKQANSHGRHSRYERSERRYSEGEKSERFDRHNHERKSRESLENAEHTSRLPKEERPRAPRLQLDSSEAATIFVGIGRNRRVYPRDLVGLLVSVAKIDRERIGDIRVLANYSFIQLYTEDAEKVISALNGYDYRGRKLTVNLSKPKDENLSESQSDEIEFEKKENAVVTQTEAKSPETPNAEKTSSADSVPSANDKPFSQTTDDGQVKSHFGDGATY